MNKIETETSIIISGQARNPDSVSDDEMFAEFPREVEILKIVGQGVACARAKFMAEVENEQHRAA